MSIEKPNTKLCKHCQTEIPYAAKVCPQCRKKQKSGGWLKWLLVIIAVLFLFIALGSESDDADVPANTGDVTQNGDVDSTAGTVGAAKTEYYVGDILQDGDMKIVFVSSGEYVEENEFSQPEDGFKYIYLKFSFENTSTKHDDSISFYNFEGYADGYAVDMYYGGDEELSASLSAGRSTTGCIYFSVPVDATAIEIEYSCNVFSDDKIAFVYEGEKDSGYVTPLNITSTEGAYKVGDIVESSNLSIKYTSCGNYVSDNMFVQPRDGYYFVSCEFEFENLGDSDEFISSWDFDCYADGQNCEATYIRDDDLSATISSGRKVKGTVTFEVPIGATVIEVEYLSNYWTSNRVVFTVK